MKTCPKCGANFDDNAVFCAMCGYRFDGGDSQQQQGYNYDYPNNTVDPYDHTSNFTAEDISDNKVLAMMPYISGMLGIIIALLAINHSAYVAFHIKQALKITVITALLTIATALLFWTVLVPIAAAICYVIIFVLKIMMFVYVCKGKAKEVPIICKLGFLK